MILNIPVCSRMTFVCPRNPIAIKVELRSSRFSITLLVALPFFFFCPPVWNCRSVRLLCRANFWELIFSCNNVAIVFEGWTCLFSSRYSAGGVIEKKKIWMYWLMHDPLEYFMNYKLLQFNYVIFTFLVINNYDVDCYLW